MKEMRRFYTPSTKPGPVRGQKIAHEKELHSKTGRGSSSTGFPPPPTPNNESFPLEKKNKNFWSLQDETKGLGQPAQGCFRQTKTRARPLPRLDFIPLWLEGGGRGRRADKDQKIEEALASRVRQKGIATITDGPKGET